MGTARCGLCNRERPEDELNASPALGIMVCEQCAAAATRRRNGRNGNGAGDPSELPRVNVSQLEHVVDEMRSHEAKLDAIRHNTQSTVRLMLLLVALAAIAVLLRLLDFL